MPRSITGIDIDGNQTFRLQTGFPAKMNNDEHTLQPATKKIFSFVYRSFLLEQLPDEQQE